MPRVLLDLRMVSGPLHGIARYALELARRLPALAPSWAFDALVGPDGLPADLGPLTPTVRQVRCPARFLSGIEQPALALTLHREQPDLFHATSFSLPALWGGGLVATLHDANHLALAETYRPGTGLYYRTVVAPRAAKARALITVSEFSRRELATHLDLPPERFQVIPQGVDARFAPGSASDVAGVRRRLGLPTRFLLAMGNRKPHKNLGLLARIAHGLPVPIVLLAGKGAARALGFPPETVDLGSVAEDDLPLMFGAAEALLFPSFYEGFGLPPLEAMASGCPVVASRGSSLPEVCGDAALLVEPNSEPEWRDAAFRICRDPELRRRLSVAGRERASLFSWGATAERTLAVYRRALGSGEERRA